MSDKNLPIFPFTSPFAKAVIESKYCQEIDSPDGKSVTKETFEEAIARVAHHVNKYDANQAKEMTQKTEKFIFAKDFSPAGGIWRAAGNTNKNVSFVNCTTQPPVQDSIESIFQQSLYLWAKIASFGQGNGLDISGLRPQGSPVHNCANKSTGPVSFLPIYDATMQTIRAQNRRGATKIDLWVYHPDVLEFVSCKADITKLTSQNISVKVDTAFLEAVEKNKDIILSWKRENNKVTVGPYLLSSESPGPDLHVEKKFKAKKIWNEIVKQAWKTGEPGLEFWDTSCKYSNSNSHSNSRYHIVSTNACSEQKLDPLNTCVLASLNFANMPLFSDNWQDWLCERVKFGIRFLDNAVLAELAEERSPHPLQREKLIELTRIGLGFTGLYDWLIQNNISYGSSESLCYVEAVMKVFSETAYRTSIELGKERGSFTEFSPFWFTKCAFVQRLCSLTSLKLSDFTHMRHVCCLSIAPTGTLSMVVGAGGSGCEPAFAPYFHRQERATSGEFQTHFVYDFCITNYLKKQNKSVTLENVEKLLQNPKWKFASWDKHPDRLISPFEKINLISTLSSYIDSGISVTFNLPQSSTENEVTNIFLQAWKKGLKSVTVYRDQSRNNILLNIEEGNTSLMSCNQTENGCHEC